MDSDTLFVSPRLSLIVPTLDEAANLPLLVRGVADALRDESFEILVVDDASRDGTADVAERLAASGRPRIRVVRRRGPRGLAASILEGLDAASGSVLGVIDADLQHDPALLPRLLELTKTVPIAVGSRYGIAGGCRGWSPFREAQSRLAAWATRRLLGLQVRDPLSGYFMIRRAAYRELRPAMRAQGWKALLEILARTPSADVAEASFTFGPRHGGRTKFSARVITAWAGQLARLVVERVRLAAVPPQREALGRGRGEVVA